MKITILVLVLAAVSAFAADQTNEERLALVQHLMKGHDLEGSHVEKLIEKLMNEKEQTASEQDELDDQDIDSILVQMQEEDGDDDIAMLQELIAREQDPEVKTQFIGWLVGHAVKHIVKHVVRRHARRVVPRVIRHSRRRRSRRW